MKPYKISSRSDNKPIFQNFSGGRGEFLCSDIFSPTSRSNFNILFRNYSWQWLNLSFKIKKANIEEKYNFYSKKRWILKTTIRGFIGMKSEGIDQLIRSRWYHILAVRQKLSVAYIMDWQFKSVNNNKK